MVKKYLGYLIPLTIASLVVGGVDYYIFGNILPVTLVWLIGFPICYAHYKATKENTQ